MKITRNTNLSLITNYHIYLLNRFFCQSSSRNIVFCIFLLKWKKDYEISTEFWNKSESMATIESRCNTEIDVKG